ncbi:MAG: response regulator, partial [Polyangiaceae bacterium]
ESVVGEGSTFRVRLPATQIAAQTTPRDVAARPNEQAPVHRGQFLVVDDDLNVANTLGMLLGFQHDVLVLTQAKQALELLLGGARFDGIFCDLMMPEMTGMDLHRALVGTASEQAERMVFVTGGAFTEAAQAFLASVPNDRTEKPFIASELDAIVRRRVAAAR